MIDHFAPRETSTQFLDVLLALRMTVYAGTVRAQLFILAFGAAAWRSAYS